MVVEIVLTSLTSDLVFLGRDGTPGVRSLTVSLVPERGLLRFPSLKWTLDGGGVELISSTVTEIS